MTAPTVIPPREEERWLPVVGWEGCYDVSDHGRVRSLARLTQDCRGFTRRVPERILRPGNAPGGYPIVLLAHMRRRQMARVHCLVMAAFVGPVPEGHEVAHNDGDTSNGHLANLRYATRSENSWDKLLHGTDNRGSKHSESILTESQVLEMVALIDEGFTTTSLAEHYGVHRVTVSQIHQGKSWAWLTGRSASPRIYRTRTYSGASS